MGHYLLLSFASLFSTLWINLCMGGCYYYLLLHLIFYLFLRDLGALRGE